jgi:hypothetical protein
LSVFSSEQLADEAISGAEADADGDGLANVLEYVIGTDPLVSQSVRAGMDGSTAKRGAPDLVRTPEGWRLVFSRRKTIELGGITVAPQLGHGLNDWTALAAAPVVLGSDDEGVEVLAVDVPLDESNATFFRLSVTVDAP